MGNYGKRFCMECEAVFEAEKRTQLCCSPECENKRRNKYKTEWTKKHRDEIKERVQLMTLVIQTQSARITELENELSATRQELEALKSGGAANEDSGASIPEIENHVIPDTLEIDNRSPEDLLIEMAKAADMIQDDPPIIDIDPVKDDPPVVHEEKPKEKKKPTLDDGIEIDSDGMKYCKRFKCKAMQLPCGQRQDCWEPKACCETKGMDKPTIFDAQRVRLRGSAKYKNPDDLLPDVAYGNE